MLVATERSATAMTAAAGDFVDSLDTEQRQHGVFPYADAERLRWHFIPNEMFPRKGVAFRTMTPVQKQKAHALLKSGLSQKGYLTATAIIELEDTLRAIENSPRFARSPLDYQFTRVRHAGPARPVGLAGRGPSPVAALRRRQRPGGRHLADLHRLESRHRQGRTEEGAARAGAARGRRPRGGRSPRPPSSATRR